MIFDSIVYAGTDVIMFIRLLHPLLFHPEDNTFGRKVRKYNSTLAGEASAVFSLELGRPATFD